MITAHKSGLLAQAEIILDAIEILGLLEATGQAPTEEQSRILRHFSGFGPGALYFFDDPVTKKYRTPRWERLGTRLKDLLSPEEYAGARRAALTAYYTPPVIIKAIYAALARLGMPEDNAIILEPGCGSGRFIAHAPTSLHFVGIEIETISARIARALYPQNDVRIEDFYDTTIPNNSIDAVTGNVPFLDLHVAYCGMRLSIHEFFLAKSIDLLKPGGILALIVTHFLLDRTDPSFRESLAIHADFLGAIRLPSGSLEGTAVCADILFMLKRVPGQPPAHVYTQWTQTTPILINGHEARVSTYFQHHRHMLLGTYSHDDRLYGSQSGYSVTATGDLATQLQQALQSLPRGVYAVAQAAFIADPAWRAISPLPLHLIEGSLFVDTTTLAILQVQHGDAVPVLHSGKPLQALIAGVAGVIILAVMWQMIPQLTLLWQFGDGIRTVFGGAYRLLWLLAAYSAIAFVRS